MQFTNGIINQLIVYDVTTNTPVINIGPGPNITITQPGTSPASTLKLTTSGTNLFSPEIIWSYFGSQKLRIRTGSNIMPTPVFMEYLTNGIVTSAITLQETQVGFGTSDVAGTPQNGMSIFDTFTRVQRPIIASQVLDGPSGSNEHWHDFFLNAGWTNFGAPFPNFRYRILPDGYVGIEGTIVPGNRANGTVLVTLPAGYRPTTNKRILWAEVGFVGASDINVNGDIVLAGAVPAGAVTISFQHQFPLAMID